MTRLELMQLHPPLRAPQSLSDLLETDDVWVEDTQWGAVGHQPRDLHVALHEESIPDRQAAVCGASILLSPIVAGHLMRLCGRLCPWCWSPQPTETLADPGRWKERG